LRQSKVHTKLHRWSRACNRLAVSFSGQVHNQGATHKNRLPRRWREAWQ